VKILDLYYNSHIDLNFDIIDEWSKEAQINLFEDEYEQKEKVELVKKIAEKFNFIDSKDRQERNSYAIKRYYSKTSGRENSLYF